MATGSIELGPAGARVRERVRRRRAELNLTFAELSRRLAAHGRPLAPLALRRLEAGHRRVDADDLTALADVLGTTPAALLSAPPDEPDPPCPRSRSRPPGLEAAVITTAYRYAAHVERWVDGDTVDVQLDLGLRLSAAVRLRLAGCDTPERGDAGHDEATAAAVGLAGPGALVAVATARDPEKYGRWLARITLADGRDVAEALIAAGHARVYDGGPRAPWPRAPR